MHMGLSKLTPGLLTLLALTIGAGHAQAAATVPTLLGPSSAPAVSDGRATITFGVGSGARRSTDARPSAKSLGLSDGCSIEAAFAGTGILDCGETSPWGLIALRSGAVRRLPGAGQFSGPAYEGGSILAMGSRWLAGRQCDESCEAVALQWHTGELRVPRGFNWYVPRTVLDSPTLRLPKDEPYVRSDDKARTFTYHRGRFSRSLGVKVSSRNVITAPQVSGWRVAWESNQGHGGAPNAVVVMNAKTGRRATLPFERFEAAGSPADPENNFTLGVTNKRLVLSYYVSGGVPDQHGNVPGVVVTLPWPAAVRQP